MNPLQKLADEGQSPWLDYIDRDLLDSGKLERMIRDDGLKGVTSNPSIFAKAIGSSRDYDDDLRAWLAENPEASDKEAYEALAVREIGRACHAMRVVYDQSGRDDGFVSLEVAPDLAHDTEGSIEEARRLWSAVDRPNLMIKIPATPAGIPAIEALIGEGINVNVTLIFSQAHYDAVARAYLRGLERLAADNPDRLAEVDSVASVFVSRVDTLLDDRLDKIGTAEAKALRGTIAIANCKMIYQRYRDLFGGDAFSALLRRGARPQRVLWGSTSTKNPTYRDVIYAEALIGPETVNTLPPQTLEAFRDHGRVAPELLRGIADAAGNLAALAVEGIDLFDTCEELQDAGVKSFADAFDGLLKSLATKRAALAAK